MVAKVIGLTGPIGCGKDTAAAFLVAAGFRKRAFADKLREEVATAHALDREEEDFYMCDRIGKETRTRLFAPKNCQDAAFREVVLKLYDSGAPLSGRTIMRLWGTEYRRAQDTDYWLNAMQEFVARNDTPVVIPDVRFPNEAAWVREHGVLVHVEREFNPHIMGMSDHASDQGIEFLTGDVKVTNANARAGRTQLGLQLLVIANTLCF